MDYWNEIDPGRRAIIEAGEQAFGVPEQQMFDAWLIRGAALIDMQHQAMRLAGTNEPVGRSYVQAYRAIAEHAPRLAKIDRSTRSCAIWMVQRETQAVAWRDTLATNLRLKLNRPGSIRRSYLRATTAPTRPIDKPTLQVSKNDTIIRLQAEVDMLRKQSGGGLMPGMKITQVGQALLDAHNPKAIRALIAFLQKQLPNQVRQDGIEAKARGKAPVA